MEEYFGYVIDLICFVTFLTPLTIGLTYHPFLVWPLLLHVLRSKMKYSIEQNWINWFEILKFVGAFMGLMAICFFHIFSEFSNRSIFFLGKILQTNIIMAVASDIQKNQFANYLNALVGLVLIISVSFESDEISLEYFNELIELTKHRSLCLFPLSHSYIFLYNMWNGAFTYSSQFSMSTRMILIVPCIITYILSIEVWLAARCLSLMLNMILRATETSDFYIPGKTCITSYVHTVELSHTFHVIWSCINIVCALVYISHLHF